MAQRTFTFLGTGTSVGIPMVGCDCPVCTSADPHNNRYRCAVLIGLPKGNLLIDTPPELRLQLLRAKVKVVHAVLNTHFHADHFYCTDVNKIPKESWPLLENLQVLVLDALRDKPHPGHFCVEEALEVIDRLKPRQAYLTHMSHELDHAQTNRRLPPNVALAHDGLS